MPNDVDELARLAAEAFMAANRAEDPRERHVQRARGRTYSDHLRSILFSGAPSGAHR